MKKVKRWVCSSCGGNYYVEQAEALGKCPSCGGQGSVKDCLLDESGVVKVADEK